MNKLCRIAVTLLAGMAVLQPAQASARDRKHKDDAAAAAVIAGIVGLGIGVAAAKHGKNRHNNYQWDDGLYGQPFSPKRSVICYPRQYRCYKDGYYSDKWTRRVFGNY